MVGGLSACTSSSSDADFPFSIRTPANCHFEVDDIEQPWTWKEEGFDYIFARDLLLCIRDWPRLIEQCFK